MATDSNQSTITRRDFIRRTWTLAGGALAADQLIANVLAGAGNSAKPPNILLIMVDQLRFPLWNSATMPLKGIETLRNEGLTFHSMHCSATPCTPSRATIFTGLHMPQHGLEINVSDAVPELNPRIPTLGHYFEHAGYRTPYFGKWHLSTDDKYGNGVGLKPYGFEEWPGTEPELTGDCEGMPGDGAKYDGLIAKMTIEWMTAHAQDTRPWFLTCSLVNPHDVMFYKRAVKDELPQVPVIADSLPGNFNDDLSTKPQAHAQYQKLWGMIWEMPAGGLNAATTEDWLRSIDYYYYVAKSADDQIVKILDALGPLGLKDDTLVVFLSDHGEMAAAHKLMGKGPFMYEESVRVPMVVRWPGRVPAGASSHALVQTVDLLPTFLDLAGIVPANRYLPGKSLKPLLLGDIERKVNEHVLMAYGMSLVQVVEENAQYGATVPTDLTPAPWKFHAINDGAFKYARYYEDGMAEIEHEMYKLDTDALEVDNLANKLAWRAKRNEMAALLEAAEKTEMAPIDPVYFNAPFGSVVSASASTGQIKLRFDTQKGVEYLLQASSDLKSWIDTGGLLTGTGNEMEIALEATGGAQFFRLKRL